MDSPYNPLDKIHLAESIARQLLSRALSPLRQDDPFVGAGVYLIYYRGAFPAYGKVSGGDIPIYVGKAVPKGGRRGGQDLDAVTGTVLFDRLNEHADTIEQASHLELSDFECRYLVVDDIFIPLGESLLIKLHQPVWNVHLAGFGNHDPGGGRYQQQRSPWDTVHPGRRWAMKCALNKQAAEWVVRFGGGPVDFELPPEPAVGEGGAPRYRRRRRRGARPLTDKDITDPF